MEGGGKMMVVSSSLHPQPWEECLIQIQKCSIWQSEQSWLLSGTPHLMHTEASKSGHHVNLYAYSCLLSAIKGHHVQLGGITSTQLLNHMVQQYLKWLVGPVRTKQTWQLTLQTPVILSFPGLSTNTCCIHKAVTSCGLWERWHICCGNGHVAYWKLMKS